jgi:hypothetical protein
MSPDFRTRPAGSSASRHCRGCSPQDQPLGPTKQMRIRAVSTPRGLSVVSNAPVSRRWSASPQVFAPPRWSAQPLKVGFSDISHFDRLFRARFGDTPSGVRQTVGCRLICGPLLVIRVVLTVHQPLPVYPRQRTRVRGLISSQRATTGNRNAASLLTITQNLRLQPLKSCFPV